MTDERPTEARSPQDHPDQHDGRPVARWRRHGSQAGAVRLRQLEVTIMIAAQSGLAAGLAAVVADQVLGAGAHVFAPAAAVGTIAAAIGQRTRRTIELLAGVGLGILITDGVLDVLGFGAWQTGVVVGLSIAAALLLAGRGGSLVAQAGGTAVLVATLSAGQRNLEVPRILDAAVGSAIGLVVVALLLPINPLRVLDKAAKPVFATLAAQLRAIAEALRTRDDAAAVHALDALRAMDADLGRLGESLSGAEEVVTLAPARWHRRQQYHRYAAGADNLQRVALGSRGLARRAATTIQYGEPVPEELPEAVRRLADAVDELRRGCRTDGPFDRTRQLVLETADLAGRAWAHGVGEFGDAVVTDLRTAASDVLRAVGHEPDDANRRTRKAATAGQHTIRPQVRRRLRRPIRRTRPSPARRWAFRAPVRSKQDESGAAPAGGSRRRPGRPTSEPPRRPG